ncbi:hypothetical protein [Streptomyces sp. NPDC059874]|uniref:hypothetical protein n=1 Tax=Streptomyces sp. NPDC059874 TaxID=3346983 RepID=UPI00365D9DE0
MTDPLHPTKPRPGDRIAALSPSAGLPRPLPPADPQLVVPVGGRVRVDGPARRIFVTY